MTVRFFPGLSCAETEVSEMTRGHPHAAAGITAESPVASRPDDLYMGPRSFPATVTQRHVFKRVLIKTL